MRLFIIILIVSLFLIHSKIRNKIFCGRIPTERSAFVEKSENSVDI